MMVNRQYQDNDTQFENGRCIPLAQIDGANGYISNIEEIRRLEYPALYDTIYLDHAGTTLYAKSLIESYTTDLTNNIFGNPHSASASSQLSTRRIDDIRLQVLRYFNADPDHFDVVFVANATAAIKLVAESFRDLKTGFWYGYHSDAHTSLVGVREVAVQGSRCFQDQAEIDEWLASLQDDRGSNRQLGLFAYPGQSNMTGDRYPIDLCGKIRDVSRGTGLSLYSLYDAAAVLSTSALDLSNVEQAPDFTALSFYKIFGFPDLGALIVRKASGDILRQRKYFAGGTVEMVSAWDATWHKKKETLHSALEDGTLPFHTIIALEHAMKTHVRIYGNMSNISRHTRHLTRILYERLSNLKHGNGRPICKIYSKPPSLATSGSTIAFNLLNSSSHWVSNAEVEKLAIIKGIQFRIGGLCNPGGIAQHLNMSVEEMKQNFASGQRCGGGSGIMNGKPTGAIRVSLGAMSSLADIERFTDFIEEFYVDHNRPTKKQKSTSNHAAPKYFVESLSVFPIKSCAAFNVPANIQWAVHGKGLAWDREWCLVHQGTNIALSQKQYPLMALLEPTIDLILRTLTISFPPTNTSITISLDEYPCPNISIMQKACAPFKHQTSTVCGQPIPIHLYTSPSISNFFTSALNVPCTLARHPTSAPPRYANIRKPKSESSTTTQISPNPKQKSSSIKLSNESPILLISTSSINHLNSQIQKYHPSTPPIPPSTFRANIVISQSQPSSPPTSSSPKPSPSPSQTNKIHVETPYLEDKFTSLTITSPSNPTSTPSKFQTLGPCQRCQMICIDQTSGKRGMEPFSTLAKTRRWDGGVWFGVHLCLDSEEDGRDWTERELERYIRIGDVVLPSIEAGVGEGGGDVVEEEEQEGKGVTV